MKVLPMSPVIFVTYVSGLHLWWLGRLTNTYDIGHWTSQHLTTETYDERSMLTPSGGEYLLSICFLP
jgi:hypothetical protein